MKHIRRTLTLVVPARGAGVRSPAPMRVLQMQPYSGYMGKREIFDDAVASFAMAYTTRTQNDYYCLAKAKRTDKQKTA